MTEKRKRYLKERERKTKEREKLPRLEYNEKKKKRNIPNRLSKLETVEEEKEQRQEAVEDILKAYRELMPTLLSRLSKIKDFRNPLKIKYKLAVLMAYGVLIFVLQYTSRREAIREMSKPILLENLRHLFPEFEKTAHGDTLARLLEGIEVEDIQESLVYLFEKLIRNKKFKNYLYNKRYLLAIDGSQKYSSIYQWDERWLTKSFGKDGDKKERYSVFVLECVFIMDNGVTLPLYSEFLDNRDYEEEKKNSDCENKKTKQDSETKSFYRLAKKIKKRFPKLKIAVTIDGIYASGPVIRFCRDNNWDFMITFKEGSMPETFREAMNLINLEDENRLESKWGERKQEYGWINNLEYRFGRNERLVEMLHVVICKETWEEKRRLTGKIEEKETCYVWISGVEITEKNVFKRCTLMGRYRWCIEENFLVMKHGGYNYEHFFSFNWNAMLGYHYLMNIGRFLNVLALNTDLILKKWVEEMGINAYLKLIKDACKGDTLDYIRIDKIVTENHYLKLSS